MVSVTSNVTSPTSPIPDGPSRHWSALKISLYESIVSQLKNDELPHIAQLIMQELQLKDHTTYCNDFLYNVYQRGLLDPVLFQRWKHLRNKSLSNTTLALETSLRHDTVQEVEEFPTRKWVPVLQSQESSLENLSYEKNETRVLGSFHKRSFVEADQHLDHLSTQPESQLIDAPPQPFSSIKPVWSISHKQRCTVVALSPDGRHAASGSQDCTVRLVTEDTTPMNENPSGTFGDDTWYCMDNKIRTKVFSSHTLPITALNFSADSRLFVSGSKDCCINIFDVNKAKSRRALHTLRDTSPISVLTFHPCGNFLYCGTEHSMIRCYDLTTLECYTAQRPTDHHSSSVTALVCADDGGYYISASFDGSIHFWDTRAARLINKLHTPHSGFEVVSLSLSCDKKMLLSGGADGRARLWDLTTGREIMSYVNPNSQRGGLTQTTQAVFVGMTCQTACIYDDPSLDVAFFDMLRGTYLNTLSVHNSQIMHIVAHRHQNVLLTGSSDGTCRYIKLSSDRPTAIHLEELNISL